MSGFVTEGKKIIVNTRTLCTPTTGVQRYTRELLSHLGNRCLQVRPSLPSSGSVGHLWEQVVLPWHLHGALLWSPGNTGPLAVANQVVTIHDAATLEHPEWFSRSFAQGYRMLLPSLIQRVRLVITNSEFSKQRLLAHSQVAAEKIRPIPLGVSTNFRPVDSEELARIKLKYCQVRPYFLTLGSLEPRKNLNRLLAAWALLGDKCKDFELLIVGGKGKIFRQSCFGDIPSTVRFLGYVDDLDLPALLSGAMAFVYPSLYEGFGLPPLEAMACGTPVVVGRAAALPETCGDAALYVDPWSVEELAECLLNLLDNVGLREILSTKGLHRAAGFRWEDTADRTWETLMEAREL